MSDRNLSIFLRIAILLSLSSLAFAQKTKTTSIDQVLDMLEKKILDKEADSYRVEDLGSAPKSSYAPAKSLKFEKQKIEGKLPERMPIDTLSQQIDSLETQIDQLSSSVQKAKQNIFDEAKDDNYIEIDANLVNSHSAVLRSFTVKINGFVLYDLPDSSGLWLPTGDLPIFAGPLSPGTHRIDVEARIAVKERNQSIPITGDAYFFVNKSFDLHLPPGTVNAHYIIDIIPPENSNGQADAKFKEAT